MTHPGHPTLTRRQCLAGVGAAGAMVLPGTRSIAGPAQPCPRLHRGVSFHHLMNWPDVEGEGDALRYVWPPFSGAGYTISAGELATLRQTGFDFVRLTVDPSIFIAATERQRADLERHAQDLVARLLGAGFAVVVDLHPVRVNPAYGPEALVDPATPDIFSAYLDMVGRVAAMLRAFPPDRLALEPFNEPWIDDLGKARRWQEMLEQLHGRVRQNDPVRPVVLNGLQWDSPQGLLALDTRPFRGSNVLYTFHYYDPHAFTHQGVQGDTRWLGGLTWPADDDNARAVLNTAAAAIDADGTLSPAAKTEAREATRRYVETLLSSHPGPARVAADFSAVSRWAAKQGVPPERVFLGEFGCVSSSDGRPLGTDRLHWLRTVREASEKAGFGWAYWAYKGFGGMQLVREGGGLDTDTVTALPRLSGSAFSNMPQGALACSEAWTGSCDVWKQRSALELIQRTS